MRAAPVVAAPARPLGATRPRSAHAHHRSPPSNLPGARIRRGNSASDASAVKPAGHGHSQMDNGPGRYRWVIPEPDANALIACSVELSSDAISHTACCETGGLAYSFDAYSGLMKQGA